MTIMTLALKGISNRMVADILGVTEGAVRHQLKQMKAGATDGRSERRGLAADYSEAIEFWRDSVGEGPLNLASLHQWLVREHDYPGSLRSVQRFWKKNYPAPRIRARRRVETPPGAQSQVDWAHFPGVIVGGEAQDLLAFRMVLSHSRYPAVVWSTSKNQLAWHRCHNEAFRRVGGVTATVRVDNEKTAIVRGAGAWGTINPSYRRYARMLCFHVDACPPGQPQTKGKIERSVRTQRFGADPTQKTWRDLKELQAFSDERIDENVRQQRCPATGSSVYEAWIEERRILTPLPEPLWEPFDLVATRPVSIDGLVAFEGRQYNVPFAFVGSELEIHGCAETVQMFYNTTIVAVHQRNTIERLVINQAYYDGRSTEHVLAPPPLGRMGRRMLELAEEPVAMRSIDYYHKLAEVAR